MVRFEWKSIGLENYSARVIGEFRHITQSDILQMEQDILDLSRDPPAAVNVLSSWPTAMTTGFRVKIPYQHVIFWTVPRPHHLPLRETLFGFRCLEMLQDGLTRSAVVDEYRMNVEGYLSHYGLNSFEAGDVGTLGFDPNAQRFKEWVNQFVLGDGAEDVVGIDQFRRLDSPPSPCNAAALVSHLNFATLRDALQTSNDWNDQEFLFEAKELVGYFSWSTNT